MYYVIYGFLYLFSLLPFWVLYFISDIFYGIIYYVIGYRKKVVMDNLLIAFPEKTQSRRTRIAKDFYHNLIDSFIESIKLISISDKEFYKRCTGNFDAINEITESGKTMQLHSGHQFNWEYANRIFSAKLKMPFVLVYVRITNKALDKIFKKIRSKNGTVLIAADKYRQQMLGIYKQQYALALVADQRPPNAGNAFWLNFFSKPAAFLYTPEKNAQRGKRPVGFSSFKKLKRGYYTFNTTIVTQNAAELKNGELTKMYRDFLEQQIKEQPANYLWSHKRWKFDYKEEYDKMWIG